MALQGEQCTVPQPPPAHVLGACQYRCAILRAAGWQAGMNGSQGRAVGVGVSARILRRPPSSSRCPPGLSLSLPARFRRFRSGFAPASAPACAPPAIATPAGRLAASAPGAACRPGRVRLRARGRGERAHKAALQRAGPLRRRRRLGRRRLRARYVARQQREVASRGGRRRVLRPRPRRAARRRRRARRRLRWRRRARRRELPGRLPGRGGRRDEPRRRRSWRRRRPALLRSRLRLCQRRRCCWAHCTSGLALPRQGQRRLSAAAALRSGTAA